MDPEAFLQLANTVTKLKMYPLFDIAHCVICCLYAREDIGSGAVQFSRRHVIASWLSSMLTIFSGGLICSLLLGEPPLAALKNNQLLILATITWYIINYSPFDVGYKVAKFLPVKIGLAAMKEIYRVKKINDGVTHAAKLFPSGYLIMVIIGTIKGNGSGFMKIPERLSRGIWTPGAFELLQPSFGTKSAIAASVLFVIDRNTDLIAAPHALLHLLLCITFVYFKVSTTLLGVGDPFVPLENLFCAVFMGGVWDSMARYLGGKPPQDKSVDAPKTG